MAYDPWTPWTPPLPPAGSYDPALDSQQYAAQRGLLDLSQNIGTANTRGIVDYGLNRDDILRGQTRGNQDLDAQQALLDRGYGRNIQDLQTSHTRGRQDYDRSIQMLQRSYQQLGNRQAQQMRASGVAAGGAALQAAAKRAQNQAIDRQPLDTNYNRFVHDNTLSQTRAGEDHQTGLDQIGLQRSRLGEDTQLGLGRLALQSAPPDASNPFGGRDFQDRTTQLVQAQRENSAFGLDVNAQRYYQAAGAGWQPPQAGQPGGQPSNEFRDASGNPYRIAIQGNQAVAYNPAGRELWRRPRGG